jgi:hypothetical protein
MSIENDTNDAEQSNKSEYEGIIVEAIASMIYVFVCCGVVASTSNVTFDELVSDRHPILIQYFFPPFDHSSYVTLNINL